MTARVETRVHQLADRIQSDLDAPSSNSELARVTHYSRAHLIRTFKRITGETPTELKRRLRLERAAFQLSSTKQSVTDVALDAGYESLEAFTRSFGRAFKVTPSLYRRVGTTSFWLHAPSGIHFEANPRAERKWTAMDVLEEMFKGDFRVTRDILERARGLGDAQLDSEVVQHQPLPFEGPDKSLRQLLHRQLFTYEIWLAAMEQRSFKDDARASVAELSERLNAVERDFLRLYSRIRDSEAFAERFVDALCEPPETFTYGFVFAHILNFGSSRRALMLEVLRQFGARNLGFGDVIQQEAA
jgi:AraC family transcriptional regulator